MSAQPVVPRRHAANRNLAPGGPGIRRLARVLAGVGLLVLAGWMSPVFAAGDVVETTENGFVVETAVEIDAAPDRVWEQLVRIAEWWNGDHSFSGDAGNLRLEAVPGGCFCETLPGGGGLVHLSVIHVAPGALLRLSGGLGPLQEFAVSGLMQWRLEEIEGGTRVTFTYRAHGAIPGGPEAWAGPVDGVIAEQLYRLESLMETGAPTFPSDAEEQR